MYICGQTYRMEPNEALELADKLVDAVEQLRAAEMKLALMELQQGEKEDVHS